MEWIFGALAQLGEHLLCKQGVIGSIPIRSTNTEFACEFGDCESDWHSQWRAVFLDLIVQPDMGCAIQSWMNDIV